MSLCRSASYISGFNPSSQRTREADMGFLGPLVLKIQILIFGCLHGRRLRDAREVDDCVMCTREADIGFLGLLVFIIQIPIYWRLHGMRLYRQIKRIIQLRFNS